jgi:hypothetical protein
MQTTIIYTKDPVSFGSVTNIRLIEVTPYMSGADGLYPNPVLMRSVLATMFPLLKEGERDEFVNAMIFRQKVAEVKSRMDETMKEIAADAIDELKDFGPDEADATPEIEALVKKAMENSVKNATAGIGLESFLSALAAALPKDLADKLTSMKDDGEQTAQEDCENCSANDICDSPQNYTRNNGDNGVGIFDT